MRYVQITDPNHVLRPTDELTACENIEVGTPVDVWGGCITMFSDFVGRTIGSVEAEYDGKGFWYRCLVEDAPTPKNRIRLFLAAGVVVQADDLPDYPGAVEIFADSKGFYTK